MTLTCDAVLFDMDGTILNSAGSVRRQWERWAQRRGIDLAAVFAVSHGRRTIETMRLLCPGEHLDQELADFVAGEAADLVDVTAMAGAAELAARLPGERWAIVTSSSRAVADARLAAVGFPQPGALITADDVTNGKPHPEPWLRAAAALGVAPERCVVFEDANSGIQAARAAGMRVVGVAWSHEKLDCTDILTSFNELQISFPDLP